jgi:acyl-CoA hydrolase
VVTEFGTASLHGKNLRERANELIRIAHPDFREELSAAAHARKLLPKAHAAPSRQAAKEQDQNGN